CEEARLPDALRGDVAKRLDEPEREDGDDRADRRVGLYSKDGISRPDRPRPQQRARRRKERRVGRHEAVALRERDDLGDRLLRLTLELDATQQVVDPRSRPEARHLRVRIIALGQRRRRPHGDRSALARALERYGHVAWLS